MEPSGLVEREEWGGGSEDSTLARLEIASELKTDGSIISRLKLVDTLHLYYLYLDLLWCLVGVWWRVGVVPLLRC